VEDLHTHLLTEKDNESISVPILDDQIQLLYNSKAQNRVKQNANADFSIKIFLKLYMH